VARTRGIASLALARFAFVAIRCHILTVFVAAIVRLNHAEDDKLRHTDDGRLRLVL